MRMIRRRKELLEYLEAIGYDKLDYRVAVEALIFTPEGKMILEERGPGCRDEIGKLEGVGGRLEDYETDLHESLQEEIHSELGADVGGLEVKIDRLLEVHKVQFEEEVVRPNDDTRKELKDWVVVSYLCRVIAGEPRIGERHKIAELHELTLDEIYELSKNDISRSLILGRETYQAKYGNRPYYEVPEDAP